MRIRADVRVWEGPCLAAILLLAAGLRLWGLSQNGYGNLYYAAGVRSMMLNWRNFFFAAYDPAGFVSLDKPPVAFWVQAAFAKLLGFSGFSLLLPQALAGVATVLLIYHLVRRVFGSAAGLLAALSLAITPVTVAVDRVNNTDGLLVLAVVLAAWPMLRAAETGRLGLLLLSMGLVGVAFNVKMLAAYVVLPAFVLVYLLTAPVAWRRRLVHLTAAAGVLVAVSLSWAVIVDLTPPADRPYVGDSRNNTELDLLVGYNGIARLVAGTRWGFARARGPRPDGPPAPLAPPPGGRSRPGAEPGAEGPIAGGRPAPVDPGLGSLGGTPGAGSGFFPPIGGRFGGGEPGPLRFAGRGLAGQITWLIPLAALGLLAAALQTPWQPADPRRPALLFWSVWLVSGWIVFSFAGGMFHPFYVVTMGPALAALIGAGGVALWEAHRGPGWGSALLPASLVLTAAWEGYILGEYPEWRHMLVPWLAGGSLLAVTGLIVGRLAARHGHAASRLAPWALAVGLLTLFISPTAWALTPVFQGGAGGVPAAGPDLLARAQRRGGLGARERDVERLIAFLQAHRRGERYLLATANAMQASPIIIQTGEPVMAIGGWGGSDPILTLEQFARLVTEGQVRYVLAPDAGGRDWWGGRLAGSRNAELLRWVAEHGKPVDPGRWRAEPRPPDGADDPAAPPGQPGGGRGRRGGFARFVQLYDCRPSAADQSADAGQSD